MIRKHQSNMPEHRPCERSANIWGLGVVRLKDCGHQQEPQHFEAVNNGTIRAVCPYCHAVMLEIEMNEDDSGED